MCMYGCVNTLQPSTVNKQYVTNNIYCSMVSHQVEASNCRSARHRCLAEQCRRYSASYAVTCVTALCTVHLADLNIHSALHKTCCCFRGAQTGTRKHNTTTAEVSRSNGWGCSTCMLCDKATAPEIVALQGGSPFLPKGRLLRSP
jgi:hypothetical protein